MQIVASDQRRIGYYKRSPSAYSKLANETESIWSEDGKILVLTIKKENEEKLEIIKFDVDNNFQIISQEELKIIN